MLKRFAFVIVVVGILVLALDQIFWVTKQQHLWQLFNWKCTFNIETAGENSAFTVTDPIKFNDYITQLSGCTSEGINFYDHSTKKQYSNVKNITFILTEAQQTGSITTNRDGIRKLLYSYDFGFDEAKRTGFIYLNLHPENVMPEKQIPFILDAFHDEINRVHFSKTDATPRDRTTTSLEMIGLSYEK